MNSRHGKQTAPNMGLPVTRRYEPSERTARAQSEQAVAECAAAIEAEEQTWEDATPDPAERFRFLAERIQAATDQIDADVMEMAVIATEWRSGLDKDPEAE